MKTRLILWPVFLLQGAYTAMLVALLGLQFCQGCSAAPQPYQAGWRPITKADLLRVITSPETTAEQHLTAIRRSQFSQLEEVAVAAYDAQRLRRPKDAVLQSAFGLAYWTEFSDANLRRYHPALPELWRQQLHNMDLTRAASKAARQASLGPGKNNWFCWYAEGVSCLVGFYDPDAGGPPADYNRLAIEALAEAAKRHPSLSLIHSWLALSLLPPGDGTDLKRSLAEAQRAAQLDPSNESAYEYQSRAYAQMNRYKEAYVAKKQAVALLPSGWPEAEIERRNLEDLEQRAEKQD